MNADMIANPESFRILLINKKGESGSAEVLFRGALDVPSVVKEDKFDVSCSVLLRGSISVREIWPAERFTPDIKE